MQNQLTKSFASAQQTAAQYPQYASQITAAAKASFVDGQDWAYFAGIVAIVLGAALVFFMFPKHDAETAAARGVQAGRRRGVRAGASAGVSR